MDISIYLIIILILLKNRVDDKYGKISEKKQYINYILLALIIYACTLSFNALSIFIINMKQFFKLMPNYYYMPKELNILIWITYNILNISVIFLAYFIAQRKKQARYWLIKLLPYIYFIYLYEITRELYTDIFIPEINPLFSISFFAVILIIPFIPIYYFYSRKDVKEKLFIQTKN